MTAVEYREYTLRCDHPGCRWSVTGSATESRAKVRQEAAKRGWAYVRSPLGRALDADYCPAHKKRTEEER